MKIVSIRPFPGDQDLHRGAAVAMKRGAELLDFVVVEGVLAVLVREDPASLDTYRKIQVCGLGQSCFDGSTYVGKLILPAPTAGETIVMLAFDLGETSSRGLLTLTDQAHRQ